MTPDPARFDAAAARFSRFFDELSSAFVERTDVLTQVALGLLAKEHVLLAGPPGTAKSQIASSVFNRIVCEESGKPSVYARQITESTVQTDLIGPVDFKHLMETGRTTHFTDEGMLGASHAFLDEVFDGRDMLLRSALNVLQERELKQGTSTTRGRIECALMTSNRYVSDIIEQSRETLLAFLDRIAFVGFVPRGFADPQNLAVVLRRTVGGAGNPRLDALLTLQDLDVLQAAVNDVYVAPEICEALAKLLDAFDAELAAACRADPAFAPTRYVSTRTAVRCGRVLRAIAIFERIFHQPKRTLEVIGTDLGMLRLHLLLSGPAPAEVEKILDREVDPIERRQLMILKTEREIFDACMEKLGPIRTTPKPRPAEPPAPPAAAGATSAGAAPQPAPVPDEAALRAEEDARFNRQVADAAAAGDHGTLVALARSTAEAGRSTPEDDATVRDRLGRLVAAIGAVSIRAAIGISAPNRDPLAAVRSLVALARSLEDGTASMHPTANWVSTRALAAIDDAALHGAGPSSALYTDLEAGHAHVRRRLDHLQELLSLRTDLARGSASSSGPSAADTGWQSAITKAEDEIAAALSAPFCEGIAKALQSGEGSLAPVLDALAPELARLDEVDARVRALAGRDGGVKTRVAGGRVGDLVRAALVRGTGRDRAALVDQIKGLSSVLESHGLMRAIEPRAWLAWTGEALVKNEPAAPSAGDSPRSRAGWLALRGSEQRTPIAYTLAEVALLVSPAGAGPSSIAAVAALLDGLPAQVRDAIVDLDVGRAERALDYLERWWGELEKRPVDECVAAGVFDVLWDEAALARIVIEARLIEELMPSAASAARKTRARVEALAERVRAGGIGLLEARADAVWRSAMGEA